MYRQELKVNKLRIPVLIGTDGETKRKLEKKTNTEIIIDSEEGDVIISSEDSLNVYDAKQIVTAINRGFNPDIALKLLQDDYIFELIDITDFTGKHKKKMIRMKGRIIGADGKARKLVEEYTDTSISVFGKTAGVIGHPEGVNLAKRALEGLLSGSPHGKIYAWLERQRKKLKLGMFVEAQDL